MRDTIAAANSATRSTASGSRSMPDAYSLDGFIEALGSDAPTPGGGAAAALAGALAAALAEMVARLTTGRPRFQEVETAMRTAVEQASAARRDLFALIDADERAYADVNAAYKLPKATPEEKLARDAVIQQALRDAMQPPLGVMRRACDVLTLAGELAASGNPAVVSDAGCAALLGEAAVRAAALNVLANAFLLRTAAEADAAQQEVARLEEQARALREHVMGAVHTRMRPRGPRGTDS
jgi:formiminotetrahydrofolate cyclodeaminase